MCREGDGSGGEDGAGLPGAERPAPPESEPPDELRVAQLQVGDLELVVLSYPAEPPQPSDRSSLTAAEAEVAELAIAGMSNAEIGAARGTSERTVANQMASIFQKLGLRSRRELAVEFGRGR